MLKLLSPFVSAVIGSEVAALTTRAKRNGIFYTLIAFAVLVMVVFLLIAAYFALAVRFGLIHSALLIAAVSAIFAVAAFAVNKLLERAERRRLEQRRAAIDINAALTTAAVAAVPALLKRPLISVAVPVAALLAVTLLSRTKKPESNSKQQ